MRRKLHLFTLITGLLLFIFDLGSDIYVAVKYYKNGESWWFGYTLSLIIVPFIIVNFTASVQFNDTDFRKRMCILSCFSIFRRYYKEFKLWKSEVARNSLQYFHPDADTVESMYQLALLRYVEAVTESVPQWCLQTYIMFREWHFPWYILLSTVFSLLSLAWSITMLERVRAIKNKFDFNLGSTIVFLIWQLSNLISRLFAIAIFAYAFRYHVFTLLAIHWLIVFVTLRFDGIVELWQESGMRSRFRHLLELWIETFPLLFHVPGDHLYLKSRSRCNTLMMSGMLGLENLVILVLSLSVSKYGTSSHMEILKAIAITCVVGGVAFGVIFYIMNYCCCYPGEIKEKRDDNDAAEENRGFETE